MKDPILACTEKMRAAGVPEPARRAQAFHLTRLIAGEGGTLSRNQIEAIEDLPDSEALGHLRQQGTAKLDQTVIIKLNGGLGTGMGLERAKSLLEIRHGLCFLDLIARQVLALRASQRAAVPLLLMNSFRTDADSRDALASHGGLADQSLPLGFTQHRVPKLGGDDLLPAEHPDRPELEWCPPGHGDLYTALVTSGALRSLLDNDIDYAFVSNADNLGASLDPLFLGFMESTGARFVMEVADRTPADRKGGHLCRLVDGRLALRESAQCPASEEEEFQDIGLYRYFNSNNLWFHLPTLGRLLEQQGGFLPLATLVNRKRLDPRDPDSAPVIQLETAMGAAISIFPDAAAVRVPRRRFSPVKNTDDLLAARSDAYELTADGHIALHPDRSTPPTVTLDRRYYRMIDDFEQRFPNGPPSLRACDSLTIDGDAVFAGGVVLTGDVHIAARSGQRVIPAGATLSGSVDLD